MAAADNKAATQALKAYCNPGTLKKEDKRSKKAPKDTLGVRKEESVPIVHLDIAERLSGKLKPGYSEPYMAIDETGCS